MVPWAVRTVGAIDKVSTNLLKSDWGWSFTYSAWEFSRSLSPAALRFLSFTTYASAVINNVATIFNRVLDEDVRNPLLLDIESIMVLVLSPTRNLRISVPFALSISTSGPPVRIVGRSLIMDPSILFPAIYSRISFAPASVFPLLIKALNRAGNIEFTAEEVLSIDSPRSSLVW